MFRILSAFGIALSIWTTTIPIASRAQENAPLYEQTPYDVITLNEENKNASLQVFPLDFPDRKIPVQPDPDSDLIVKLLIIPEQQYRLKWKHVASIRFFETSLLAEVDALIRQQRYEEAFPYFRFLISKHRNFPGVSAAYEAYLKRVIELAVAQKQHDQALARVFVWHEFHPGDPTAVAYGVKVLEHYLGTYPAPTAEQTVQAAHWLLELEHRIPAATSPTLQAKREQLATQAAKLVTLGLQQFEAGRIDDAELTLTRAELLRPDAAGLDAARKRLLNGSSRITIELSHGMSTRRSPENGALDWRTLRDARFLAVAPVVCVDWSGGLPSYQSRLVGDPVSGEEGFLFPWKPESLKVLQPLEANLIAETRGNWPSMLRYSPHGVRVSSSVGQAASDGWLAQAYIPPLAGGAAAKSLGAWKEVDGWYRADSNGLASTVNSTVNTTLRLRLIASKDFETTRGRLQAGEIQFVDRIAPWQVQSLTVDRDLAVVPYAVPAVHLLIVNPRSTALATRTGRAAIAAAVRPQSLLEHLTRGTRVPGAEVSNGIWPGLPKTERSSATMGIPPTADRDLAKLLWQTEQAVRSTPVKQLTIRLPNDETAQFLVRQLQAQFAEAGIELKSTIDDQPFIPTISAAAEADLIYWIWHPIDPATAWPTMFETPLYRGLLSDRGQACYRDLLRAKDSTTLLNAASALEQVLIAERRIVPLLQVPEFAAHAKSLTGVGARPLDAFQNVSEWKIGR